MVAFPRRIAGHCCFLRMLWLLSGLMLLLWELLAVATGLPVTLRHTKDTPAVHSEASQSKSNCGVHVCRTFCCFSPPLSHSLALGGMYGRRDGCLEGGGLPALRMSLRLFGEFADDTDQCSIFIFKTLVVCFQVNQNL